MVERSAPSGRRPLTSAMRVLNTLPKLILRSPLHGVMSDKLLLLSFGGRTSGKRYTVPISYVRQGETLLLASDRPWWRNLQGGARVSVRLRGEERPATAEVVADDDDLAALYGTILAENPVSAKFLGITPGPDGQPDAETLRRAAAHGVAMIRLRLD